jgi:hypothetical protein
MTEYFRRTVLRFFTERKLLSEHFARNMLSWRHSGFSPDAWPSSERSERPGIDNSVRILDESSRENLAQYIARPSDAHAYRKAWARLLSKVYGIDPMVCPRMHGRAMSIANDQP